MRRAFVGGATLAITTLLLPLAQGAEPSLHAPRTVEFEGKRWVTDPATRVTVDEHEGKAALCVQGGLMSYVYLPDTTFQDGTIEVDIATASRSAPGIGFHGTDGDGLVDRVTVIRTRGAGDQEAIVVNQANITRRRGTLLYLRVGVGRPEEARTDALDGWFHLKVVVQDQAVSVYLDGDTRPCIEVREMFDGNRAGTVGVCGSNFYFAGFRYTPTE